MHVVHVIGQSDFQSSQNLAQQLISIDALANRPVTVYGTSGVLKHTSGWVSNGERIASPG